MCVSNGKFTEVMLNNIKFIVMCHLQVKVSHELSSSCAMCVNYERQLQKMQDENQKFQNLASNLQVALDQEKVWNNLHWYVNIENIDCL